MQGESCDDWDEEGSSSLTGEGCPIPPFCVVGDEEDDEGGYPLVVASFASFPGRASASVIRGTLFCG